MVADDVTFQFHVRNYAIFKGDDYFRALRDTPSITGYHGQLPSVYR